jgi:hypothetical protein
MVFPRTGRRDGAGKIRVVPPATPLRVRISPHGGVLGPCRVAKVPSVWALGCPVPPS